MGLGSASAAPDNIVFPDGAKVVDITKPPYNATPNDDTDDTEAFQKALREEPFNWLIYVPNGTYIISDTLHWSRVHRRQVLQGQSQDGTIIRLRDKTPKFMKPDQPEAMIWTGKAPAQRFRNGIRNLTIDTGVGNPGAIGARFIANNQGGIANVTFRSGDADGRGPIGLDLGYTNEQGPCLIKNVTVRGFDVGVYTKHGVDSVTFEHLTLENQRRVGLLNEGQVINLRGLTSRNKVPAVQNAAGTGVVTLLEANLTGGDGATAGIINEAGLFARAIKSDGYKQAIQSTGGKNPSPEGSAVLEFHSHPPVGLVEGEKKSLNLPIQETPEVAWDPADKWVSVTDFGPPEVLELRAGPPTTVNPLVEPDVGPERGTKGRPRPVENWAPALQRAIDSGATTIYFPHRPGGDDSDYGLHGPIHVRGNVRRIFGCETALGRLVDSNRERSRFTDPKLTPVFIIEEGAAPVVVIERFNTWYTAPRVEHRAKRTLAIKNMSIYDLETYPGAGDVFLEDVRAKKVIVNDTKVWARQLNTEGVEEPRNLVKGKNGQMWILGLKTENDTTIAQVEGGATLELCGGFFYSNKDLVDQSIMFINRGGRISATFGEFVGGKVERPFDIVQEWRGDQPQLLKRGQTPGRAGGSMATLLISEVR